MPDLISAQAALAEQDRLRFVDCSFYLPTQNKDAAALFAQARIPGALFFDIDEVADHSLPLPHMMPSPTQFAAAMAALGIARDDRVVLYDQVGLFSAARGWLTFRQFGHPWLAVLDGGLPAWRAAGGALEAGKVETRNRPSGTYPTTAASTSTVVDAAAVAQALAASQQVLDARPAARFEGTAPEPRPGLRSGHMPGARNLPHSVLLTNDGRLRPEAELRAAFLAAGIDLDQPIITTCGSGVTAAVLSFALFQLGRTAAVYDGSWAQWGDPQSGLPVATAMKGRAAGLPVG